ncbi:UNVERIFIED_CONTAM: hypothetical protein FKN15_040194 [Acipenser sinensis]
MEPQRVGCIERPMEYPLQFLCRGLRTVGLVLLYYCFSIGITFYNKWLLKEFHFPLFMTLVHLMIIFILAAVTRTLMQCWTGKPRVVLGWSQYLTKAAPTGLQNPVDTMYHLQPLMFVGLFPLFLYNEGLSLCLSEKLFRVSELPSLLHSLLTLSAGGALAFGLGFSEFLLVSKTSSLTLSISGIFKPWPLPWISVCPTGASCSSPSLCLQNPVDTMYHLQPLMFVGLFPLFLYNEGLSLCLSEKLFRVNELPSLLHSLLTLSAGGALAFGLRFSEFLLVSKTSSLTLSISGIFKEVCTLLLAAHLMGDEMSVLNWLGFAVCLSGIYGWRGDLEGFESSQYGTPSGVERSGGVRIVSVWDSFRGGEEIWRGKAGQVWLQSLKNSSSDILPLLRRDGCSEEEEEEEEEDHDEDH